MPLQSCSPGPEIVKVDAILTSTAVVALAEIGDKTMLLAIVLAARFRAPVPIILGILVATLANHGIAAFLGHAIAGLLDGQWFRYAVGIGFVMGNLKREAFLKAVILWGAFLFAGLLGALFLSSGFITLSLLALTFLSGCLVAAAISRPSAIYMMAALGGGGLGASFLPQAGQFPAAGAAAGAGAAARDSSTGGAL